MHESLARQYGRPATAPHLRAATADECQSVLGGIIGEGRPAKSEATLDDLAANAIGIYRARATQVTPGFYAQTLGSLVTAEVVSAIRSTPLIDTSHGLHVFHLYARFAAGNNAYCAGWAPIEPGDEFIVYAYDAPADESHTIVAAETRIFIQHGNKVLAPAGNAVQRRTPAANLDELQQHTIAALHRNER